MKKIIRYISVVVCLIPLNFVGQDSFQLYSEEEEFIIKSSFSLNRDKLNEKITRMFTDPIMRNANWGFVVYDPENAQIINSYNENAALIPASTTKLLTTETALSILGKDYRWTTQLEYSGEIDENGALNGNLYIIGSGDPSLGTGRAGANTYGGLIAEFIQSVKNLGIKRVKGDIILKTAVFKENNKSFVLPNNIVWRWENGYYLPIGSTNEIDHKKEKS
ncbi:MAG: D-alanyl-D-alanine carboxypeptidase, partial [Flavobacteriaceae bacterium]|nr:D-alanyl-D-alanine carboxypeptidase [Flavobacteriaceae bacterium]